MSFLAMRLFGWRTVVTKCAEPDNCQPVGESPSAQTNEASAAINSLASDPKDMNSRG